MRHFLVKRDDTPPDQLPLLAALGEIALILLEVAMGVFLYFVAMRYHQRMHNPPWMMMVALLPAISWICWRMKSPNKSWPMSIFLYFSLIIYLFVAERFWPTGTDWGNWSAMLVLVFLLWLSRRFDRVWKRWMFRIKNRDTGTRGEGQNS